MKSASHPEVTELLLAWSEGKESALEKLIPLVHKEPAPAGASVHVERTRRSHVADDGPGE